MRAISAVFRKAQTERVGEKTFTASGGAVATSQYTLNSKMGTLLTLHNIGKLPPTISRD